MTDLEKPKATRKKKPPTQTAGVNGINAHGGMGELPTEPFQQYINWDKLISLPAFEMFILEESGQNGSSANEWIANRRSTMGDEKLYSLYANWHQEKGYWTNETPMGSIIKEVNS